jgi:hypothetical protein
MGKRRDDACGESVYSATPHFVVGIILVVGVVAFFDQIVRVYDAID